MSDANTNYGGAGNDTLLMDFNIFNQRRTSMLSAVDRLVFDTRPSQMEGKVCGTETIMELMSQWDKVAKTSMNFRDFYMGCVDNSLVETADSIYATNDQIANALNTFGDSASIFNSNQSINEADVDMLAKQEVGGMSTIKGLETARAIDDKFKEFCNDIAQGLNRSVFLCTFDAHGSVPGTIAESIEDSDLYTGFVNVVKENAQLVSGNSALYKISPLEARHAFEVGGAAQSFLETGNLMNLKKNTMANYDAFRKGGMSYITDFMTGHSSISELLKIKGTDFHVGGGIGALIPDMPEAISEKFALYKNKAESLWNHLVSKFNGKNGNLGVEDFYKSAGYFTLYSLSKYNMSNLAASVDGINASQTGALNIKELLNNAGEADVKKLRECGFTNRAILEAVENGETIEGLAKKCEKINSYGVSDETINRALKDGETVETILKKCEKLNGYGISGESINEALKEGGKLENLCNECEDALRTLRSYKVSNKAIKEALKSGYSILTLAQTYDSFQTPAAVSVFNKVLEQDYDGAFKYLATYEGALIEDDNLMSAVAVYGFSTVEIDSEGNFTPESQKKFEAFINGLLNANGTYQNYSAALYEKMYILGSTDAIAYNNSVLITEKEKVGDEAYARMVMEARKRLLISNFYATESIALKNSSIGEGGLPDGEAEVNVTAFSLHEIEVSNRLIYDRLNSGKEADEVAVKVTQYIGAGSIDNKEAKSELNKLEKERDELIYKYAGKLFKDVSYSINPLLGYAVRVIADMNDSFSTDTADDIALLANEMIKTTVDPEASKVIKASATTKSSVQIVTDVIDYFKEYNKISDDINASKEDIKRKWFGYTYGYCYNNAESDFYWSMEGDAILKVADNPIRPDAYQLMREWEEGGIDSLILNSDAINRSGKNPQMVVNEFNRIFRLKISNTKTLTDDQIKLAKKLVLGDKSLDFNTIDYEDFCACIDFLDGVYADVHDGNTFTDIRNIWDSRVKQYGGGGNEEK